MFCCLGAKTLSRANPTEIGLVTDDVVDCLQTHSPTAQEKYKLTSFCNLDNVTDFKLDPPKGAKVQAALVSVTGFIDETPEVHGDHR